MKKGALFLVILLIFTTSCSTTNWVTKGDSPYGAQMGRMLGRGASNVICAPLEIINQPLICASGDNLGEWIGGFGEGLWRGIFYGIGRGISGVFDICTFFAPHRGLMEPEFIEFAKYPHKKRLAERRSEK